MRRAIQKPVARCPSWQDLQFVEECSAKAFPTLTSRRATGAGGRALLASLNHRFALLALEGTQQAAIFFGQWKAGQ
jgi:hypothetical protein